MFKPGEYIQHASGGLCQVEDVTTLEMSGTQNDRLYYRLRPLSDMGRTIFTPVDNRKVAMRPIMTRNEIEEMIRTFPDIEEIDMTGDRNGQRFKQALSSVDCEVWVGVIKTLQSRRRRREREGKKIPSTDEMYYRMARDRLHEEFSVALKIHRDDVEAFILDRL